MEEDRVAVIPYPVEFREQFQLDIFLSEMHEFKHTVQSYHYAMGAFGTFGNPSSYHHPEIRVREVRRHALPGRRRPAEQHAEGDREHD
ncbi:hypothetical protein EON64_19075, partial [archaeon]